MSVKITYVDIQDRTFDDALDFVNFVRAGHGYDPIDELQPGFPNEIEACTIVASIQYQAYALAALAYPVTISAYNYDTDENMIYECPANIKQFMHDYDKCRLNEKLYK